MQTNSNESKTEGKFYKILGSPTFIDRTNVISGFCYGDYVKVVVGPREFGKSTIVDMLKCFLEIQVDENGIILSEDLKAGRAVKDTTNYNMFMKHKLRITEDTELMDKHFGQYPVILVSFTTNSSLKSQNNVIRMWAEIVHHAYKQHKYLLNNTAKLNDYDKRCLQFFCDEQYDKLGKMEIIAGLNRLSHTLFRHFKRRCIVLVDNYDSMLLKPNHVTRDKDIFDYMGNKMCFGLGWLVKHNFEAVFRTFITGSNITSALIFFADLRGTPYVFSNDSKAGFIYKGGDLRSQIEQIRQWEAPAN